MFALAVNLSTMVLLALVFLLTEAVLMVTGEIINLSILKYLYRAILFYAAWSVLVAIWAIGSMK